MIAHVGTVLESVQRDMLSSQSLVDGVRLLLVPYRKVSFEGIASRMAKVEDIKMAV
jgi:hypothetical protein